MKINKFIVFIISIIFIIGITFSSYATDIDNPDVGGGTNSETPVDNSDNNNENTNDNNNNNNDENNTTNENEQSNNQGTNPTRRFLPRASSPLNVAGPSITHILHQLILKQENYLIMQI